MSANSVLKEILHFLADHKHPFASEEDAKAFHEKIDTFDSKNDKKEDKS